MSLIHSEEHVVFCYSNLLCIKFTHVDISFIVWDIHYWNISMTFKSNWDVDRRGGPSNSGVNLLMRQRWDRWLQLGSSSSLRSSLLLFICFNSWMRHFQFVKKKESIIIRVEVLTRVAPHPITLSHLEQRLDSHMVETTLSSPLPSTNCTGGRLRIWNNNWDLETFPDLIVGGLCRCQLWWSNAARNTNRSN